MLAGAGVGGTDKMAASTASLLETAPEVGVDSETKDLFSLPTAFELACRINSPDFGDREEDVLSVPMASFTSASKLAK